MRLFFGPWCVPWPGRKKPTTITGGVPPPPTAGNDDDDVSVSSAIDATEDRRAPNMTRALSSDPSTAEMAALVDAQDLKTLLDAKDMLIRNLETLLEDRNNEIQELRSHLDMFQSVFPFSNPGPPTTSLPLHQNRSAATGEGPPVPQQQNHNYSVTKSLSSLLDGIARPRKQRAQGISAEPQSLSTIQELSQKKFLTYPKNDR